MVNVTYNIPETGPPTLYSVRPLSLRAIYAVNKPFVFTDYSAVSVEDYRLAYNSSTSFRLSPDLPEKP
jgi:hypothetical protein